MIGSLKSSGFIMVSKAKKISKKKWLEPLCGFIVVNQLQKISNVTWLKPFLRVNPGKYCQKDLQGEVVNAFFVDSS